MNANDVAGIQTCCAEGVGAAVGTGRKEAVMHRWPPRTTPNSAGLSEAVRVSGGHVAFWDRSRMEPKVCM